MVFGSRSNYVLESAPGVFYEGPFEPDFLNKRKRKKCRKIF
jgi:hypothetical protein